MDTMKCKCLCLLAITGFAAALLCGPSPAWAVAAVAPTLGVAQQFGTLGNSGVTGSAGLGTVVNGDVGSGPTTPTIINFPPSSTTPPFIVHNTGVQPDGVVQQAHNDANTAYTFLAGQGVGTPLGNNLSIVGALTPGVYSSGAADLGASTNLTLNDPTGTGIFVFNIASSLTMNDSSTVTGTANPCNIYWRVGSSATLNGTSFMGTVIADTSITVGGGTVSGRVLAGAVTGTGVVTMPTGGNTIGGCSTLVTAGVPVTPATGVALSKAFFPTTISPGGTSLLTIMLSNNNLGAVTLGSDLTDLLPIGLVVATPNGASTSCGPPGVSAPAGGTTVKLLTGSTIPGGAPGFCTVIVNVTAGVGASSLNTNTLGIGALFTDAPIQSNADAASATLIVVIPPGTAIPTLSEWAQLGMVLILVGVAVWHLRRRRAPVSA